MVSSAKGALGPFVTLDLVRPRLKPQPRFLIKRH